MAEVLAANLINLLRDALEQINSVAPFITVTQLQVRPALTLFSFVHNYNFNLCQFT
jgi:hypothetical protein